MNILKKNYSTFILLMTIFINCKSQGSLMEEEPIQLISVEVNLPWYIEFTFPSTIDLQPTSFEADVYTDGVRTPLNFFLEKKENKWIYRNSKPYGFKRRDVIAGKLEFDMFPDKKRWIPIYYTITRNRRYDAILVTESRDITKNSSVITTTIVPPLLHSMNIPPTTNKVFNIPNNDEKYQEGIDCTLVNPILSQTQNEKINSDSTFGKFADLHDEINSLKELVQTLLQHGRIGKKLILFGLQSTATTSQTLIEIVRLIISDKLKLKGLEQKIISAEISCGGILFEMEASIDKARILTNAAKYLNDQTLSIKDADSNDIKCSSMSSDMEENTTPISFMETSQTAKTLDFRIDELRRKVIKF